MPGHSRKQGALRSVAFGLALIAWALFAAGAAGAGNEAAAPSESTDEGGPVLAYFWAPWCGPCRVMGPEFARAASLLEGQARPMKINVDEAQVMAIRLGVSSVPTIILIDKNQELGRVVGLVRAEKLAEWARSRLSAR